MPQIQTDQHDDSLDNSAAKHAIPRPFGPFRLLWLLCTVKKGSPRHHLKVAGGRILRALWKLSAHFSQHGWVIFYVPSFCIVVLQFALMQFAEKLADFVFLAEP